MERNAPLNRTHERIREIAEITSKAYPLIRDADEYLMRLSSVASYTESQDDLPIELREIYVAARRIADLSLVLHFELSNLQYTSGEASKETSGSVL